MLSLLFCPEDGSITFLRNAVASVTLSQFPGLSQFQALSVHIGLRHKMNPRGGRYVEAHSSETLDDGRRLSSLVLLDGEGVGICVAGLPSSRQVLPPSSCAVPMSVTLQGTLLHD
jgi:hypothetical protein